MIGSTTLSETCLLINVGVVARGSRCLSVMNSIHAVKPSRLRLRLVAIATLQKSTSCYKFAGEMGIEVFEDYRELLTTEYLDLILELSGDPAILADLIERKRPTVGVLDRQASMLLFDIAHLYSQMDRRESEVTLARSFASTLLEASPDGVLVIDKDYRIINCNQSPLIAGSADRDSIIGKYCYEVIYGASGRCDGNRSNCPAHETQRTKKPARTIHENSCADNTTQIRQVTAYPIFSRFGEVAQIVLTIRDMTKDLGERIERRAQSLRQDMVRVAQEDRLSSLGRLVASVCHEINNPITSIVTFTKLVRSMLQKGELSGQDKANVDRYLDLSFREAMRCGGIVKNLLTFARPQSGEVKQIDISEAVTTILLLTRHQLEFANVHHVVNLPPPPFTAWGDYAQIQQCLLNLIFNAIDAMPDGGNITISGGTEEGADRIWLAVADSGRGIEPNDLVRIFEPFYSTKTDGKGVGLGLSMVYGIIREHHGVVEVESEPGKGATFTIKLPSKPTQHATVNPTL
jgi:two-component system, NtrC family, sensor kinase